MKPSLVKIRTRNTLWILALAILSIGLAPTVVGAQEPPQVGLVVQFGDGRVETRCISFEGDRVGGDTLLAQSGLDVLIDPSSGMGITVCRIEGEGCDYPAEHCFCQCMGGGACGYWNYFYREPGAEQWTYSALGAALRKAQPGAVEAWVWGNGSSPPAEDLTFDTICAQATATATATAEAETATPATLSPTAPAALPTASTPQPTTVAEASPAPTATARPAATTAAIQPTEAPARDDEPGPADYWPFGVMVIVLIGVGVLVWLRRA
jgi:hypothetical protein